MKEDLRLETDTAPTAAITPSDLSLLIVDDDKPFLSRLTRAMETRGFTVTAVDSVADGLAAWRAPCGER